jgi:hypothetical protein
MINVRDDDDDDEMQFYNSSNKKIKTFVFDLFHRSTRKVQKMCIFKINKKEINQVEYFSN